MMSVRWRMLLIGWGMALAMVAGAWEAAKIDRAPSLSANGRVAAFARENSGACLSEVMLLTGGRLTRLAPDGDLPVLSPDGRYLAWVKEVGYSRHNPVYPAFVRLGEGRYFRTVYLTETRSGKTIRLSPHGGTHPVWSPDGSRVAYVTPGGALEAVQIHTHARTTLVNTLSTTCKLTWLPVGPAVQEMRDGAVAWYTLNRRGALTRLTRPLALPVDVLKKGMRLQRDWALSRDGAVLVYAAETMRDTPLEIRLRVAIVTAAGTREVARLRDGFYCTYASPGYGPLGVTLSADGRHFLVAVEGGLWCGAVGGETLTQVTKPLY